jgi:predicted  nucleic acid-binding Zn-ribbon protein
MIILIPGNEVILPVKFCAGDLRLNTPTNSPEPAKEMSSTLFGRGINTQVGGRRRAEEIDKALGDIRNSIGDIKNVPYEMRAMQAKVISMESKVAGYDLTLKQQSERIDTVDAAAKNALFQNETQAVVIKNLQGQVDTLTTLLKSLQGQVEAHSALIKAMSAETASD